MKKTLFLLLLFISLPSLAIPIDQMEIYSGGMYARHSITPTAKDSKVNPEGSKVMKTDRKKGYYIDGRNQLNEHDRIPPPNPDKIPKTSHPTRTVEPFESYYDRNAKGLRRQPYMTPVVPNYNRFYSNRRAYPYTRAEYLDVWCQNGIKDYKRGTCTTATEDVYFVRTKMWALGVTRLPFTAIGARKLGKKQALFIMVDDIGLDTQDMYDSKDFVNMFNIPTYYGTIDSFIPQSSFRRSVYSRSYTN